jgi:hypothetical protein
MEKTSSTGFNMLPSPARPHRRLERRANVIHSTSLRTSASGVNSFLAQAVVLAIRLWLVCTDVTRIWESDMSRRIRFVKLKLPKLIMATTTFGKKEECSLITSQCLVGLAKSPRIQCSALTIRTSATNRPKNSMHRTPINNNNGSSSKRLRIVVAEELTSSPFCGPSFFILGIVRRLQITVKNAHLREIEVTL